MKSHENLYSAHLDPIDAEEIENGMIESDNGFLNRENPNTKEKEKKSQSWIIVPFYWDGFDTFATIFLLFFAAFSRFWIIHQPRTFVLYETTVLSHFSSYYQKKFFFDPHPMLPKEIFYVLALKMEYDNKYPLSPPEKYIVPNTVYVSMRSISAYFAMMTIPMIYLVLRLFNVTQYHSFCGAICAICEFSLIVSSRHMSYGGIIQFGIVLTLLIAGLSHHFRVNTPPQWILMILLGIAGGFSFSSSFLCISFALFACIWPFVRFGSKIQCGMNVILVFSVFLTSCTVHIYLTPQIEESQKIMFSKKFYNRTNGNGKYVNFTSSMVSDGLKFGIKQFSTWCSFARKNMTFTSVVRRFFIKEKWLTLYHDESRYVICFTNSIISKFGIFASIYNCVVQLLYFKFDVRNFLSFLSLAVSIVYALGYHEESGYNCYIQMLMCLIIIPITIEDQFSVRICGIVSTFITFLCVLQFFDWAPLIYAYFDPNTFITPNIEL